MPKEYKYNGMSLQFTIFKCDIYTGNSQFVFSLRVFDVTRSLKFKPIYNLQFFRQIYNI